MMTRISVHIFHSPIENESRLFKESKSIIALSIVDKVMILGVGKPGLAKKQEYDEGITILRSRYIDNQKYSRFVRQLITAFNLLLYFSLVMRSILSRRKISFMSVHNLLLLPIGSLCKLLKKDLKMIYEPHELEVERTGLKGMMKKISSIIEKLFIRYCDKILTVCPPITDWYVKQYQLNNVYTIRNVPTNLFLSKPLVRSNRLREEFNIPEESVIYIYQGVLAPFRGVNDLIDIFGEFQDNIKHLVLMGYGKSVDYILAQNHPNVHYKPAVPVSEIIDYTSGADVGVFFVNKPLSLSYQLCLPNKFFEYAISGLPVLISDNLTYLNELVREKEIGWSIPSNFNSLKTLISSISKEDIRLFTTKLDDFRTSVGWQIEQEELIKLYKF